MHAPLRFDPLPQRPAQAGRRRLLLQAAGGAALLAAAGLPQPAQAAACAADPWPLWAGFVDRFVQADGRVIDFSVPQMHSTSEGQSYAMFFALVAGDAERFDTVWRWSVANLAAGDIAARLPAWQWGQRADGSWGVIDPNPASDADLWFAYTLLEASRLWNKPAYAADARVLLARIAQDEVVDLPGFGLLLLPGPTGFTRAEQRIWRLNPSYLPVPVLRRLAQADAKGPWAALAGNTARMIAAIAPRGFVPDWAAWQAGEDGRTGAFVVDPVQGDLGSYDAIRTYLWAGMTPRADPLAAPILRSLSGMASLLAAAPAAAPPEKVRVATAAVQGEGPAAFSAALLPYLQASGSAGALAVQRERAQARLAASQSPTAPAGQRAVYYDHVLGLFGLGWIEQRYQFLPTGRLQTRWERACPSAAATKKK